MSDPGNDDPFLYLREDTSIADAAPDAGDETTEQAADQEEPRVLPELESAIGGTALSEAPEPAPEEYITDDTTLRNLRREAGYLGHGYTAGMDIPPYGPMSLTTAVAIRAAEDRKRHDDSLRRDARYVREYLAIDVPNYEPLNAQIESAIRIAEDRRRHDDSLRRDAYYVRDYLRQEVPPRGPLNPDLEDAIRSAEALKREDEALRRDIRSYKLTTQVPDGPLTPDLRATVKAQVHDAEVEKYHLDPTLDPDSLEYRRARLAAMRIELDRLSAELDEQRRQRRQLADEQ